MTKSTAIEALEATVSELEAARRNTPANFAGKRVKGVGFQGDGNQAAIELADILAGFAERLRVLRVD